MATEIQHFIGGKLVPGKSGKFAPGLQPGDRRADRLRPAGERGRHGRSGGRRQEGLAGMGRHHAAAPRPHPQPLPAPAGREREAHRRLHHLRTRQGAVGRRRRTDARHRGGRVRDRRAAAAQGRDHRERRHQRRQPLAAPAARHRRRHHAVQLPGHGADVDVPGGAGLRQLLHPEAVRARSLDVPDPGGASEGSGAAGRRVHASSTATRTAVDAILRHPDIAAVSFVGSTPIARYIYETAALQRQALPGAWAAPRTTWSSCPTPTWTRRWTR